MSPRFLIRRDVNNGFHHWSVRDALCRNVERHDFSGDDWTRDCTGACDTSQYWSWVIRVVNTTLAMERR